MGPEPREEVSQRVRVAVETQAYVPRQTYNSQPLKVQLHPSTGPARPSPTHYSEAGTEAQSGLGCSRC